MRSKNDRGRASTALLLAAMCALSACSTYEQELPEDYADVVAASPSIGTVGIHILLDEHGYNHAPPLKDFLEDNGVQDVRLVASSNAPGVDLVVEGQMGEVETVELRVTPWVFIPPLSFLGLPDAVIDWTAEPSHIRFLQRGYAVDEFDVEGGGDIDSGTLFFVYWYGDWEELNAERVQRRSYEMTLYRLNKLAAREGQDG